MTSTAFCSVFAHPVSFYDSLADRLFSACFCQYQPERLAAVARFGTLSTSTGHEGTTLRHT
jgi:hypothetical protein